MTFSSNLTINITTTIQREGENKIGKEGKEGKITKQCSGQIHKINLPLSSNAFV